MTAVGVRCNINADWECFTPYGLDDLFNGIVRHAERKAASFLQQRAALRLA